MDFKNSNSIGRSRANSFRTHDPDIYSSFLINAESLNRNTDDGITIRQTLSGKTYNANPKVTLSNTRVFTPNSSNYFGYQDDNTRHDSRNFNFNTGVSESYQFNMPSSSKQQKIPSEFQNNTFEEFKSAGIKTFCAGSTYSTERNDHGKCTEKATYCRAFFNNHEFVYRTMAKNARLQRLVRKLVLLRQKQKEEDVWNNYINELKNRHGNTRDDSKTPLQNFEDIPCEIIEDYDYDTTQMDPCQNLLNEFYTAPNTFNRNLHFNTRNYPNTPQQDSYQPYVFENQSVCYPTASQGRLIVLNKERHEKQFLKDYIKHRNSRGNIIFVDRENNKPKRRQSFRKFLISKSTNTLASQSQIFNKTLNSKSIQTEFRCLFPICEDKKDESKGESAKERYKQVAKNVEKLKRKLEKSNSDVKQNAIENIENKLNNLIKTLNTFMVDIRSNNPFSYNKSGSLSGRVKHESLNNLNLAKSDILHVIKLEEAVCRMAHENSSASSVFLAASASTKLQKDKYIKIDKILNEEMNKSNKVKRDIEDIMYQRTHCPRAVQIAFDIPTRERSTEVTESLSTTRIDKNDAEEINNTVNTEDDRMTIAVNTDPLGILGILRVSSEAVKQILSYMPHIDYYSYLSMLQFRQSRHGVPHYICNICGASFERPSQLSDHIQSHNLGYSRDCCVCRHVLDMKRHRPGLFKCQYCGQRFTRAYCCGLHEETCAKRMGVQHDVDSGLNLLQ